MQNWQLQRHLHQAAEQGDELGIQSILNAGANVDGSNAEGNTALHVAAANNRTACIGALLRGGACVDATNSVGWTALMQAVGHAHVASVTVLLRAGADVTRRTVLGMTSLGLAAATGEVCIVRTLADAGASCTDGQLSPVVVASGCGHTGVVRVLLDRGASAKRAAQEWGITPLMAGVAAGAVDTVQLLLSLGGDPNYTNALSCTALQLAQLTKHDQLTELLSPVTSVNKHVTRRLLTAVEAVCDDDLAALHFILNEDPDQVKTTLPGGVTPLLVAACLGRLDAAELLLERGAPTEDRDVANDWTPLLHAVYNGHGSLAHLLLRHRADIHVVTSEGYTVFDFAMQLPDYEIMKAYVRAKSISGTDGASDLLMGEAVKGRQPRVKKMIKKMSNWFPKGRTELPPAEQYFRPPHHDDFNVPPPPKIRGKPILPHMPTRDMGNRFYGKGDHDDCLPPAFKMDTAPVDVTGLSFRWTTSLSFGSSSLLLPPHQPPPVRVNTTLLLRPPSEQLSDSGTSCTSITDSTNTTVKTKRSFNTIKQRTKPVSCVEHLTLSLGSEQLTQVLDKLALGKHHHAFAQQDVDFEAFVELTSEDLKELGIADQVTRIKIMKAIQSLRKKL